MKSRDDERTDDQQIDPVIVSEVFRDAYGTMLRYMPPEQAAWVALDAVVSYLRSLDEE